MITAYEGLTAEEIMNIEDGTVPYKKPKVLKMDTCTYLDCILTNGYKDAYTCYLLSKEEL